MARMSPLTEHLLRRAGFSGTPDEIGALSDLGYAAAVEQLLSYTPPQTDVDGKIGAPGHVGVTASGPFLPDTNIAHARQRWLFRMTHSSTPLCEKIALFWHNHFATGYAKLAGVVGAADGARLMDARPFTDLGGMRGQIQMYRDMGLGSFLDMLVEVAKHPSMSIWLDGRQNTKAQPQENFGREIMELFTFGVANYTEADVYAAARVFTGWNYTVTGDRTTPNTNYQFVFNAAQHDTAAKTFSFPIYPNKSNTIPARTAAAGMQDGIDLMTALALHPETARRLARKLWTFFVSETKDPDPEFVNGIAAVYLSNNTVMKPVIRAVLMSPQFIDAGSYFQRYAWPVEYVVRSLKEVGCAGFSVNDVLTPLTNMGQVLYEPPDVAGWDVGTWWFSTNGMLSRMNFASQLAANQKFNLRDAARPYKAAPESLLSNFCLQRLTMRYPDLPVYDSLINYVKAGGTWTGSDTQLTNKAGGLMHLLMGSPDYQFV